MNIASTLDEEINLCVKARAIELRSSVSLHQARQLRLRRPPPLLPRLILIQAGQMMRY